MSLYARLPDLNEKLRFHYFSTFFFPKTCAYAKLKKHSFFLCIAWIFRKIFFKNKKWHGYARGIYWPHYLPQQTLKVVFFKEIFLRVPDSSHITTCGFNLKKFWLGQKIKNFVFNKKKNCIVTIYFRIFFYFWSKLV